MEKETTISNTPHDIEHQSEFESLLERVNENFSTLYNLIVNSACVHNPDPKVDLLAHYILHKYQSSLFSVLPSSVSFEKSLWPRLDDYLNLTPYNDRLNRLWNSDGSIDFYKEFNAVKELVKDDFSLLLDIAVNFLNKLMQGQFTFVVSSCSLGNFNFNEGFGLRGSAIFTITIK